jgi:hypothetical protein
MGGVFWRGGSEKVVKPTAIFQVKMEDTYILLMWSKLFDEEKWPK